MVDAEINDECGGGLEYPQRQRTIPLCIMGLLCPVEMVGLRRVVPLVVGAGRLASIIIIIIFEQYLTHCGFGQIAARYGAVRLGLWRQRLPAV